MSDEDIIQFLDDCLRDAERELSGIELRRELHKAKFDPCYKIMKTHMDAALSAWQYLRMRIKVCNGQIFFEGEK